MNLEKNNKRVVVAHVVTSARTINMLEDHIEVMKGSNIEYHVVGNFYDTRFQADEVRFHHVELKRRLFAFSDLLGAIQVFRALKKIKAATIICSTPKGGLVGSLIAFVFFNSSQRIFLVRGYRFPTLTGFKRWVVKHAETIPARLVNVTLSTSIQSKEMLQNILPARMHSRLGVTLNGTANGIDIDNVFFPTNPALASRATVRNRYGISDDAFLILVVARVCVDKGFEELVKAFENVKSQHPHAVLLVVGEDDSPDALPAIVHDRLNQVSIRAGRVKNKDMPEIYRAADILVYPSRREGFGISAIEAAAMATPTLAARVGGLQSAVAENVSGVFHPVKDSDAIADWLKYFIENPTKLSQLSTSARAHVADRFNRSLYDAFWLEVYRGSTPWLSSDSQHSAELIEDYEQDKQAKQLEG